jgi:hypothetical protein
MDTTLPTGGAPQTADFADLQGIASTQRKPDLMKVPRHLYCFTMPALFEPFNYIV